MSAAMTQSFYFNCGCVFFSLQLVDQQYPQYGRGPSDPCGSQPVTSQPSGQREDGRKIMHPIKESSQEDMLRLSPNEPIGTQKFIVASTAPQPLEARPPPVPPKSKRPVSRRNCRQFVPSW